MAGENRVRDSVIEILGELLAQLDCPAAELNDDISLRDIGLDSASGLEFVCEIEDRFNCKIPDDSNLFVDDEKRRLRTVGELISSVSQVVGDGRRQ